jgi:DNA-binding transcriptional LysR family regulator
VQWDDLRVFLAVAESGSLRRAAHALRLGQPTVGRHLRQLERSMGAKLFERSPDGHRLTREGQDLLPMAQTMADTATAIDRRRAAFGPDAGGAVRIMAGEWVARFLAPRLANLAEAHDDLTLEIAETHQDPDLERRAADIYIKHGLPSRGRLIRTSLGSLLPAVYGARAYVEAHPDAKTDARWRRCSWVAYDAPHELFSTMAWLAQRLGGRTPRVRANRIALQLEAIRAGAGLGVLPCFVGDADPALVRATPPIPELEADYWLLVHPDMRAVPRVRRVIEWIRMVFKEHPSDMGGARRTPHVPLAPRPGKAMPLRDRR